MAPLRSEVPTHRRFVEFGFPEGEDYRSLARPRTVAACRLSNPALFPGHYALFHGRHRKGRLRTRWFLKCQTEGAGVPVTRMDGTPYLAAPRPPASWGDV